MSSPAASNITSVLKETRKFPPPPEFAAHAHVKSLAESERLWQRARDDPEGFWAEQAQRGVVNESTDIYNFGATMYRLVTWKLPPRTQKSAEGVTLNAKTFEQMLKPVQELNPKAPVELCNVIHRCLRFTARDRPERVSEVQGDLDRLADKLVLAPEDRLEAMEW